MAGHPVMVFLNHHQIVDLRADHLSWKDIAILLDISPKVLRRWRRDNFMVVQDNKYTDITEHDLDKCLKNIMVLHRSRGEIICKGLLESEFGVFVKWTTFRACILRVDPLGPWWRKFPRINRGLHQSPGPNYTWHLDSNHKLRSGKMVIHGCIDGFSRYIKYLVCCDNNRSITVLNLFRDCVQRDVVPQRIYTDQGGENIQVAHYMLATRGPGHHGDTIMVGKSVHNQRIERLWRDINHITYMYKMYFHILSNQHNIDLDDPANRYVINRLFIPLINEELDETRRGYNQHKMRTMDRKSQSPNKAVQRLPQFGIQAPLHVLLPPPNDEFLDYHGIVVEANVCPLTEVKKQHFEVMIPSLQLHILKEAVMVEGQLNPVLDADGVMQAKYAYFDLKVTYALYVYDAIVNAV